LVHLQSRIAQGGSTARSFDDALELDQHQLAGAFEDISTEFGDQRLDDLVQKRGQPGEAIGFVAGKQPGVAGHQDRRQPAPGAPSGLL